MEPSVNDDVTEANTSSNPSSPRKRVTFDLDRSTEVEYEPMSQTDQMPKLPDSSESPEAVQDNEHKQLSDQELDIAPSDPIQTINDEQYSTEADSTSQPDESNDRDILKVTATQQDNHSMTLSDASAAEALLPQAMTPAQPQGLQTVSENHNPAAPSTEPSDPSAENSQAGIIDARADDPSLAESQSPADDNENTLDVYANSISDGAGIVHADTPSMNLTPTTSRPNSELSDRAPELSTSSHAGRTRPTTLLEQPDATDSVMIKTDDVVTNEAASSPPDSSQTESQPNAESPNELAEDKPEATVQDTPRTQESSSEQLPEADERSQSPAASQDSGDSNAKQASDTQPQDNVIIEREGKIQIVSASDVQAIDPELNFTASPPKHTPSERPQSELPRGHDKPQSLRRVQSASVASPISQNNNQSVGHSERFQGPGKHLHRFKNVEARDAFEAWYERKQHLLKQKTRPKLQTKPSEEEMRREAQDSFEAWRQRKEQQALEARRQAREEKRRQTQVQRDPLEAKSAFENWKQRKAEQARQQKKERMIRTQLLDQTAALIEERHEASQIAVYQWLKRKQEQAKRERMQEEHRLKTQRRQLRTMRRSLKRPQRRFQDDLGYDATSLTTRSLPATRPVSHVSMTAI
eukprot:TRINITY_DN4648_c0_g1_i1.p1 TRINITY_DN4648_c0_g1~~TRINITY_DN4648_c0_g1_i1.p1  ORF type:complete len:639 (+),score=128.24 TRINITY_DN4648_c0_g1_i1:44-1960(+)